MRIDVIGAGPAGLYSAILLAKARPDAEITVFERNAENASFGFGVVFSDEALGFLRADDPETVDLIEPHMTRWRDITVVHRGERITIDGVGFSGIGRLELLSLLRMRATELGVAPRYGRRAAPSERADLVIGADGLNSVVRASGDFGVRIAELRNRFAWYGANREFDTLTQTFVDTPHGPMNAHHYSYAPGKATFIVEMAAETFEAAGMARLSEDQSRAACEGFFAETLGGASLITNNSVWRRFPVLSCSRWYEGNRVLVGDALHTAHFSIGSGTRLALEDVQALIGALKATEWDVAAALPAYQAARQPVLEKIVRAASASANWYEAFGVHMAQDPWPFALSYIRRAGRLSADRLRRMAPEFAARAEAQGFDLEVA